MNEKTTWYLARSGGLVAWGLLAAAIIFGLLLSSRILSRERVGPWTLSVHRFLGGLSVLFTGIHLVALHLDDFVEFGILDFLIPFRDTWRPGAVAWGVIGFWLLLAIEGSSLAMKYLPRRLWRAIHFLSPLLFGTATMHGFKAGSDAGQVFMGVTLGLMFFLIVLTGVRMGSRRERRRPPTRGPTAPTSTSPNPPTAPVPEAESAPISAQRAEYLSDALPSVEVSVLPNELRNAGPTLAPAPHRGASSLPAAR